MRTVSPVLALLMVSPLRLPLDTAKLATDLCKPTESLPASAGLGKKLSQARSPCHPLLLARSGVADQRQEIAKLRGRGTLQPLEEHHLRGDALSAGGLQAFERR